MNNSVTILTATALVCVGALFVVVLAQQPAAEIPWLSGAYVAVASALLIGFPVRSLLRLLRWVSLPSYVAVGVTACFAPSAIGVAIHDLIEGGGAVEPVSWFGTHPVATIVFIAAYAACGGAAAALYWVIARPDRAGALVSPDASHGERSGIAG